MNPLSSRSRSALLAGLLAGLAVVPGCATTKKILVPPQTPDTVVGFPVDPGAPNGPVAIEGRPLRRGRRTLVARRRWGRRRSPTINRSAAAWWARTARFEHASITAFHDLAARLNTAGAPRALVERCREAARQEHDHTMLCRGIAQHLRGRSLTFSPLRAPERTAADCDVHTLAVESLRDGALNEGYAAVLAACHRKHAAEPMVTEALAQIAADEATHADLAWDVIDWCLRTGGSSVADALREAAIDLRVPKEPPVPTIKPLLAVRYGVMPADPRGELANSVFDGVQRRLAVAIVKASTPVRPRVLRAAG